MNDHELRRARRAVRAFGWLAVLFGLLLMAWTWQMLERPDVAMRCQQELSTSDECKRTGLYAGAVFALLGLPLVCVRTSWLNRHLRRSSYLPDSIQ